MYKNILDNSTQLKSLLGPSCVIQWATRSFLPPRYMADIIEEVIQLSGDLNVSFNYIMRSTNAEADKLAKEGVLKPSLLISAPT